MSRLLFKRNIFVDSQTGITPQGSTFKVSFPGNDFNVEANQTMKLRLVQFNMRRNWHAVNASNNEFYLHDQTNNRMYPIVIPSGDYETFADLAPKIRDAVDATLAFCVAGGTNPVNGQTYPAVAGYAGTTSLATYDTQTRKIKLVLSAAPPGINVSFCSFRLKDVGLIQNLAAPADVSSNGRTQDVDEILGGDATEDADLSVSTVKPLYDELVVNAEFKGFYPAQLNSIEAVYLRCSTWSQNYQTSGYDTTEPVGNHVVPTSILARFPLRKVVANEEPFIDYSDENDNFSATLQSSVLQSLTFSITDDKNRPLVPVSPSQYKRGKLACKFILAWEVWGH